jgi:hypothetical protein
VTPELAVLVPEEEALALLGSGRLDPGATRRLALAVAHHAPLSTLGELVRLAGQRSRESRAPGPDPLEEAVRVMAVRREIHQSFRTHTSHQEAP